MRNLAVIAVVAACSGSGSRAGAGSGSATATTAPPKLALELVRCTGAPLPPIAEDPLGGGPYGVIGHGHPNAASTSIGQASTRGDLDKAVIRRYIRRNLQKITYCYEQQLVVDPKLEGTIDAHFVIDHEGNVTSSKADGLDPKVAACVALVIAGIHFPKPAGAGGVHVNYPFTFRSAGSDPVQTVSPPPPSPPPPPDTDPPPPPPDDTGAIASVLGGGRRLGTTFEAWTPYALAESTADATAASTAASQAIEGKLAELDHCFATGNASGSLRAMLAFSNAGAITRVRVGGLGDAAVESCLRARLRSLALPAQPAALELACDLRRGGDQPWRVTPAAGYRVIAVHKDRVDPSAYQHPVGKGEVVLVIADADTPEGPIRAAFDLAGPAAATLLAVGSGAAPTFAAVATMTGSADRDAVELSVQDGKLVPAMAAPPMPGEPLAQAEHVLAAARARCGSPACAALLALDHLPPAQDLLTIALAARRAGFERVGIRDHAASAP
ncbi:MAG: AgmX/PglI C-terminal domain-containing protein [Acidobacteriota bacterium]